MYGANFRVQAATQLKNKLTRVPFPRISSFVSKILNLSPLAGSLNALLLGCTAVGV
jgi:hypothetical protein